MLEFQSKLRNLGVIFDSSLTFESHVQSDVKTSFFYLRDIAKLRPMLSLSAAEKLMYLSFLALIIVMRFLLGFLSIL